MEAAHLLANRITELEKDRKECGNRARELTEQLTETRQQERSLQETIRELQGVYDALTNNVGLDTDTNVGARHRKQRASHALRRILKEHMKGLTIGDCARLLEGQIRSRATNQRNTISTTLYNMKKRGEVVHDPDTGRYSLVACEKANDATP